MKKITFIGAIIGVVLVPIASLGLASRFFEVFGVPLTLPARIIVVNLINAETAAGGVLIGLLILVNAFIYALLFAGGYWVYKKTNQWVVLALAVALYLIFFFSTGLLISSPTAAADIIQKEIKTAAYCTVKDDCVQVESKCPFGCYAVVNKNEAERIQGLIDSYESTCIYSCVQFPGFDCVDNTCTLLYPDPPGIQEPNAQGPDINEPEVSERGSSLDISSSGLQTVSQDIFRRTDLRVLNVSNNSLTGALPAEIRNLRNLEVLDASNNQMTGLPAELGQLTQLRVLDVSNNQLTGLPYELGNLSNLEVLNLSGNDVSEQDLAIISGNLPDSVSIIR